MRTCAICGMFINRSDICSKCFKKWCPEGMAPDWVIFLKRNESHFQRYVDGKELPFSDFEEHFIENLSPWVG